MSTLVTESVRRFLKRIEIQDTPLIAAVSGGADSVAMLRALIDCANEFRIDLSVGHFDHGIRPDSAKDALWVEELSRQLGVNCSVGTPNDVPEVTGSGGIEETARKQRYAWLSQLAKTRGAKYIAVAHSADDQVETVLHHIIRGTGLKGLQGIPEVREHTGGVMLLRPVLSLRRCQLEQDLSSREQSFLTDESNRDLKFTRNRIRHDVLPLLRESFNPQIEDSILRLACQASTAQETLTALAEQKLQQVICSRGEDFTALKLSALSDIPPGLIAEVLVCFWEQQQWPRQAMTQSHWHGIVDMILNRQPRSVSLPGQIQATLRKGLISFHQSESKPH